MPRGVQRARVDNNHTAIIDALRQAGICAHSAAAVGNGFPDIVAGFRGLNVLLEVKNGERPCDRALTAAEQKWHVTWAGQVAIVSTPEQAINAVVEAARNAGML